MDPIIFIGRVWVGNTTARRIAHFFLTQGTDMRGCFTIARHIKLEEEEQEIKVFNNPGKIQKFKITDQEIGFSVSDACELSAIKIEVIKSVSRVEVNIFRASDKFVKLQNRGSLKKSIFSYVNSQKKKVTFAYPLKLRGKKNYVLNLTMEHGTVEVAQLVNERQVIDRAGEVRITGTETSIKSLFIK